MSSTRWRSAASSSLLPLLVAVEEIISSWCPGLCHAVEPQGHQKAVQAAMRCICLCKGMQFLFGTLSREGFVFQLYLFLLLRVLSHYFFSSLPPPPPPFLLRKELVVNSKIGGCQQTKRIEKDRILFATILQFNTFFSPSCFPALSAQTKDPILFFPPLHVVLLETRIIKPTFNLLIPTIFSSPKFRSHTLFLAAFNENNLPPFSSRAIKISWRLSESSFSQPSCIHASATNTGSVLK